MLILCLLKSLKKLFFFDPVLKIWVAICKSNVYTRSMYKGVGVKHLKTVLNKIKTIPH